MSGYQMRSEVARDTAASCDVTSFEDELLTRGNAYDASMLAAPGSPQFDGLAEMMFGGTLLSSDATTRPMTNADRKQRDGLKYDPNFRQMANGGLFSEADLPENVKIPKEIVSGLDERYGESLKHDRYERGGNLVIKYNGDFGVRPGGVNYDDVEARLRERAARTNTPEPEADKGGWEDKPSDVGLLQRRIGTIHTHAYDDDAVTGTFSGEDLSRLADEDQMMFVRSGNDTMMATRSREFSAMVEQATRDDDGSAHNERMEAFQAQMTADYYAVYNSKELDGKSTRESSEAAARAVMMKYHLAYYEGQGQQLSRVK